MKAAHSVRTLALFFVALTLTATALAQITAVAPYTISVFATSVLGVYFQPDSIAVLGDHIFVGYGNNVATDGSDGKSSTIVEYDKNGNVITTYSVKGHNDGLKVNPVTHLLWSMQNEDANPNLVIINPANHTQTSPYAVVPTAHGGGYDDISFRGNDVFFSASNPQINPNTAPAIVRVAQISGSTVNVTPVLMGNATAIDIPTDSPVTLNLQDPDSMHFNPLGDLVLDSQADAELIIVHDAGELDQTAYHVALTENGVSAQIDDTVWATASHGVVLVSDRDGETVYAISRNIFSPNAAYSATPTAVAELDMYTGVLTDVVTGMVSPHGEAFIKDEAAQPKK